MADTFASPSGEDRPLSTGSHHNRQKKRRVRALMAIGLVAIAVVAPILTVPQTVRWWQARRDAAEVAARGAPPQQEIFFPQRSGEPIKILSTAWEKIGLQVAPVNPTARPRPINLDGVLYIDPDDHAIVRSRFEGEVVEISSFPNTTPCQDKSQFTPRGLRFGDEVKKGQVLAVVWSRELGEKKSELAECLSELEFDRETLQRRSSVEGAIAQATIREAERRVRQDEITADRIIKTLRSWQLLPEEIEAIRDDVVATNHRQANSRSTADSEKSVDRWARVEIHSPIDGTIVEKNVTVGALVDSSTTIFKIANLDHLDIRALAYEEDLNALQKLSPEQRKWSIQLKGDRNCQTITGSFERIGNLIDPVQHTGLVMGWVDNRQRNLRAGQFVSCAIDQPDSEQLMTVPATSVVDVDGHSTILLQSSDDPQLFKPVQVRVVRFQEDEACIASQALDCPTCLSAASRVVVTGAMEILAEYREHLQTHPAGATDLSSNQLPSTNTLDN